MRGRRVPAPSSEVRIRASDLGLPRFPELGALVQFSTAGSRASRESLNRLAEAAAHSRGRVVVVELTVRRYPALQDRLGIRYTPSVYLVDGEGRIVAHWARAPERRELDLALVRLAESAAVLAAAGV